MKSIFKNKVKHIKNNSIDSRDNNDKKLVINISPKKSSEIPDEVSPIVSPTVSPKKNKINSIFKLSVDSNSNNKNTDNLNKTEDKSFNPFKHLFNQVIGNEYDKQVLLSFGINLKEGDEEDRNIIHRACLNLKTAIVNDLLSRIKSNLMLGSSNFLETKDMFGNTALLLACKKPTKRKEDRLKILKQLIDNGANFKVIQPSNLWTPLHWLSFNKDDVSVNYFLKDYSEMHYYPDKDGYFPIDLAGLKEDKRIVELFIQEILLIYDKLKKNNDLTKTQQFIVTDIKVQKEFEENHVEGMKKKTINNRNSIVIDQLDFELDSNLKALFLGIYIHHCLYWVCKLHLNYIYVNQLLEYEVDPTLKLYIHNKQNAFHVSAAVGNFKAAQLMFVYYTERFQASEKNNSKVKKMMINLFSKLIEKGNLRLEQRIRIIRAQPEFNLLKKDYQNYLISLFPFIIKQEKREIKNDVWRLKDQNGNNPFHLACNYGKLEFIELVLENDYLKRRLDFYLNKVNNDYISAYAYIKNKQIISDLLIKSKRKFNDNPPVVLLIGNKNKENYATINTIIKVGKAENLQTYIVENIERDKLYIAFDITEEVFRREAEHQKIAVKKIDINTTKPFEDSSSYVYSVEPFFSRFYQDVIFNKIDEILDLDVLKREKILLKIFFMHKPSLQFNLYEMWLSGKWYYPNIFRSMIWKYIFEKKDYCYNEINLLYRYFGEKIAIYYAFSTFVIINLIPLVIVSIVMICIYRKDVFTSNLLFPYFSFITLLWSMLFIGRWERKNREIIQKWGINNFTVATQVRENFIGDEYYNNLKTNLDKHDVSFRKLTSWAVSLPLMLIVIASIVIVFYFSTILQDYYKNTLLLKYIPGIFKSVYIGGINILYNEFAYRFTEKENHKYEETYEYSIIMKLFSFRIVSELTAVVFVVFSTRDVEELKALLYMLLVVKCATPIALRFILPLIQYKGKEKLYFNNVKNIINNQRIEKNVKNIKKERFEQENKNLIKTGSINQLDVEQEKESILDSNNTNDKNNQLLILNVKPTDNDIIMDPILKKSNVKINNLFNFNLSETPKGRSTKYFNYKTFDKSQNFDSFVNFDQTIEDSRVVKYLPEYNKKIDKSSFKKINPDYIELNNRMNVRQKVLFYYADLVLVIVIMILFSSIIPLAPIIFFILLLINHHCCLYSDLFYYGLSTTEKSYSIGLWKQIISVATTASIIFNCFLLYFFNFNQFNEYYFIINGSNTKIVNQIIDFGNNENGLFTLLLIEHGLLLLREFIKYILSSYPNWVHKENQIITSVNSDLALLKEEEQNQKFNQIVEETFSKLQEQIYHEKKKSGSLAKNVEILKNKLEIFKEELLKKNTIIKNQLYFQNIIIKKAKEMKGEPNKKFIREINYLEGVNINEVDSDKSSNNSFRSNEENDKLVNFSPNLKYKQNKSQSEVDFISTVEKEIKKLTNKVNNKFDDMLENVIGSIIKGRNIVLDKDIDQFSDTIQKIIVFDILKNSFIKIENEIIVMKFRQVYQNTNEIIILCSQCFENTAIYKCLSCEDERFCLSCKNHHISNRLFETHKLKRLVINRDYRGFIAPEKENIIDEIQNRHKEEDSDEFKAVKASFYSFPTTCNSLAYDNLKELFGYFFQKYIEENGISENNKISFKKSIELKLSSFENSKVNPVVWINQKLIIKLNNLGFNSDELFVINRICFLLFKRLGYNTTIQHLFDHLIKLQDSCFEERVKILLNLIDIYDNKMIFKTEVIKLFEVFYIQPFTYAKHALYVFFKENNTTISYDDCFTLILKDNKIRKVFGLLLQIE